MLSLFFGVLSIVRLLVLKTIIFRVKPQYKNFENRSTCTMCGRDEGLCMLEKFVKELRKWSYLLKIYFTK